MQLKLLSFWAFLFVPSKLSAINLKAQNWKQELNQKLNGYCSLSLPSCFLSFCSYNTQYYLPRNDTIHSDLGPPTSIINQEITLWASMAGAFSQMIIACVKLT